MKRIAGAWVNVNMGKGHQSLALFARQKGKDPKRLGEDELLLFINRKNDKMKVMGHGGLVIGYLRLESGKIDMEALQYIPTTFGANGLDYPAALRQALEQRLARRATQEGPLNIYRAQVRAGLA